MSSYRFTPQAIDDLFEIWSYIATDDVDAADRVEEGHLRCVRISGKLATRWTRSRRFDAFARALLAGPALPEYWIVYDPKTRPLQVIRILHAARNISSLL